MTKEKLRQIAFERLEEIMVEDSGEDFNVGESFRILQICMERNCGRIGILIKRRNYWMSRDENPLLYDKAVSHYEGLDRQKKGGPSHEYCFPCGENFKREFFGEIKGLSQLPFQSHRLR